MGGSFRVLRDQIGTGKIEPLLSQAAELAGSDAPADRRVAAIRLLAMANAAGTHELFERLLDARQPAAVQMAALQGYGALVDRDAARRIIERWKSMSPAVRREAVEVLFSRKVGTETVLSALESRELPLSEIDPRRLQRLVAGPDRALGERVQKIMAADSRPAHDRRQVVAAFQPALPVEGDRDRGREVFVKVCATCHQAEGRGTDVGPNLASVVGPVARGPVAPYPRPESRGRAQLRQLQRRDRERPGLLGDHRRGIGDAPWCSSARKARPTSSRGIRSSKSHRRASRSCPKGLRKGSRLRIWPT